MAVFDEEPRKVTTGHELGQDLSALSVDELTERIDMLKREVERLELARAAKTSSLAAADAFFRKKNEL
jgi:uncharacterized small protein (DUF1192 family)